MSATDEQIRTLIYQSCLLMDQEDFDAFMALCTEDFHYKITTSSPELRCDMTWLDLDREEMRLLLGNLPQHVRVTGKLTRHLVVYLIDRVSNDTHASVTGSLSVFETDKAGASRLFAVGTYEDKVALRPTRPLLQSREVKLTTRQLGVGSHIPL